MVLLVLLCAMGGQARAQAVPAVQTAAPLLMAETAQPLTLAQAQAAHQAGDFKAALRGSLGLNSPAYWMLLEVDNPSSTPQLMHYRIGMSWLDRIDLFVVNRASGKATTTHTRLGDDLPGALHVVPGLGQVVPVLLQPGPNALWVRVHTPDPLLLTPQLLTPDQLAATQRTHSYGYGALYGYIAALAIFFGLLWLGLGMSSNSGYSVYLLSFIALNIGYTGHGWAMLWSDMVGLQRYVNLLLMAMFGSTSLVFGVRYLGLSQSHPALARVLLMGAVAGLVAVPVCALLDVHAVAVPVAFVYTLVATTFPVVLGTLVVAEARGRDVSANFYLAAILWGLGGAGVTTMTVWGLLPFSNTGFHALEFGVAAEATLLALGLANQIRERERGHAQVRALAGTDPLTGLPNRRAFDQRAQYAWTQSSHRVQPLAALIMDIDHFKAINDQRGHAAGDDCLRWLASQILDCCRASDIPVRWGGDEFVVLLPDLGTEPAVQVAERIRALVAQGTAAQGGGLQLSVGVATRGPHTPDLATLLEAADQALLAAKRAGRNQVVVAPARFPDSTPARMRP
jgi:two-component system, sensor histidine kinase LadS